MRSRTAAVGVGFLLNSTSKVTSWSCVALWRFWFFCCCVRVLFRGGRREADPPAVVAEAVGDGVVGDISRSALMERMVAVSRPAFDCLSVGKMG